MNPDEGSTKLEGSQPVKPLEGTAAAPITPETAKSETGGLEATPAVQTPAAPIAPEAAKLETVALEQTPLEPNAPVTAARAKLTDLLRLEFGLLRGRPLLWGALFIVALAPSLYAVSYLSSVWNPYGNLSQLPVGLVNDDAGTTFQGKAYNLGNDLRKTLLKEKTFDFKEFKSLEAARAGVRRGDIYFSLSVPQRFSRDALSGEFAQKGRLGIYAAEGTSYFAATLAKRFGSESARGINEQLSENRWQGVLEKLSTLRDGFKQLKSGAGELAAGAGKLQTATGQLDVGATQLRDGVTAASVGATQLSAGAGTISAGVTRLTAGTAQIGGAIRTVASSTPKDADLEALALGSAQVASGGASLSGGLTQLSAGSAQLSLSSTALSAGLTQLGAGGTKLGAGAAQLSAGLQQAQAGGAKLSAGTTQLEAGLKPVPMPPQGRQGIADVSAGAQNLNTALTQLSSGAADLSANEVTFNAGVAKANEGGTQLAAGAKTLSAKTAEASNGASSLSAGAAKLDGGVQRLTGGLKKLNAGLTQLTAKLPAQKDLDALSTGAATLAAKTTQLSTGLTTLETGSTSLETGSAALRDGATKLSGGLQTLNAKIPATLETLPGDAKGLSASVETKTELTATVPDNGTAFTPYFMVLSLWFGATLTSFVFAFNKVPVSLQNASQGAKVTAKFMLPALLVIAQAVLLLIAVRFTLGVSSLGLSGDLIVLISALAFLSVVTALLSTLGDAGRLIAVILLVVQLGAAGGAYPIELAPPFFQAIHPFLPFTSAMKALRAAMFGSYDGAWQMFTLRVVLIGAIGWAFMLLLGRWRWKSVADAQYAPALEI